MLFGWSFSGFNVVGFHIGFNYFDTGYVINNKPSHKQLEYCCFENRIASDKNPKHELCFNCKLIENHEKSQQSGQRKEERER